ncbi:MAG: hypothetical protein ACI9SC_000502, partial [Gammaproteobacteria bacterium]
MSAAVQAVIDKKQFPSKVGRFDVNTCLGKSALDAGYLAHDPELDRQVFIKTLDKSRRDQDHLVKEARI